MISRRRYYDIFSHFYDAFIRLHSRREAGYNRSFLVNMVKDKGDFFLDLCSGTGEVALRLAREGKKVVALDFSKGMLRKAKEKGKDLKNIFFVVGDAMSLPFKNDIFDACTCSYAFYELKGIEGKRRVLSEVSRVLKDGGVFCMMEHELPRNPIIRFLLYLRLFTMGKTDAMVFLRREMEIFREFFSNVVKKVTPSGRSKVICGAVDRGR